MEEKVNEKVKVEKQIKKIYELSENFQNQLVKEIKNSIRSDLWKLYYLKQIDRKDRAYLELEFDKIIFKDQLKGGNKE